MCFCAGASFTAAAALGTIGILSVNQTKNRNQIPLAIIPFLFAIQQAVEGFVWISAPNSFIFNTSVYFFLIFAFVIWPTYVPLSLSYLEENTNRQLWHERLTLFGGVISCLLAFALFYFGATAHIEHMHIKYIVEFPKLSLIDWFGTSAYLVATIAPFFIASDLFLTFFGVLLGVSCIVSYLVWQHYFISIWCFFAAILSILILAYFIQQKKAGH